MEPPEPMPVILIADDEAEIITLYKRKFEKSGFRVLTAPDGEQAMSLAASEHPDLILMDIKMPHLDGIATQKRLSDDPRTKDIRVVFLTAFSEPAAQEMYESFKREEHGPLGIIRKGGDLNELVSEVREYLKVVP